MLDPLSTPRRPYDFGDYIDIPRRNIGWLIAPTFAGLVVSTVVAFMMTDSYYSEARFRVTLARGRARRPTDSIIITSGQSIFCCV